MSERKTLPPKPDTTAPATTTDEARKLAIAQEVLRPSTLAANTLAALKFAGSQTDIVALTDALREQQSLVAKGDLSRPEAMLIAQAHTLDGLFCALTKRATLNLGEYIDAAERYLRLALRAQAQCARTLETLATIKNPPVLFAKQANIAHGPQQVNNETTTRVRAHARETENPQNRLLEQQHGERLDPGTASTASEADPAMATVGEGYRAEDRRR